MNFASETYNDIELQNSDDDDGISDGISNVDEEKFENDMHVRLIEKNNHNYYECCFITGAIFVFSIVFLFFGSLDYITLDRNSTSFIEIMIGIGLFVLGLISCLILNFCRRFHRKEVFSI